MELEQILKEAPNHIKTPNEFFKFLSEVIDRNTPMYAVLDLVMGFTFTNALGNGHVDLFFSHINEHLEDLLRNKFW